MRPPRGLLAVALLTSILALACEDGPPEQRLPSGQETSVGAAPDAPADADSGPVAIEDPFAYCGHVVNADEPGAPYAGDPFPAEVFRVLADVTGIPPEAPVRAETPEFDWRCMDGFVYACTWGPNLPCGKADLDSRATPEMVEFCSENFDGTPLPGSLTGHQTIYGWVCRGETPATTHRKYEVDPRGFVASFWHWIAPSDDGRAATSTEGTPSMLPSVRE